MITKYKQSEWARLNCAFWDRMSPCWEYLVWRNAAEGSRAQSRKTGERDSEAERRQRPEGIPVQQSILILTSIV